MSDEQIDHAFLKVKDKMRNALIEKGRGAFSSSHELLGALSEEWDEFKETVHAKNREQMTEELFDLAVGVIFGIACLQSGLEVR